MAITTRCALLLGLCWLMLTGCARGPQTCAVCDRDECTGMGFRVTLESGKTITTCCPRCGLHYGASQKVRAYGATDFSTGQSFDAAAATFVSGSDVHPCSRPGAMRDAQGCCAMTTYDRCLPSLVAFREREAAVAFQKKHGGELITFAELVSKK